MTKNVSEARYAGVASAAVLAKTGKTWERWFAILDKAGARKLAHKDIALYLSETHRVPDWWCQMVTVGYEQARGLRQKHERPDGYSISKSVTLLVPIAKAYAAWDDPKQRALWLDETRVAVRKATANKTMRITWVDGKSSLEVYFWDKGPSKCQVVVQHSKLATASAAAKMKSSWAARLNRLKAILSA